MNPVMAKALLAVSGIEQIIADPAKAAAAGGLSGFDLSRLPKGTDVFALLGGLPAAQRAQISAQMDKQFSRLGDSMIVQSGIRVVKAEYEALGMDTAKMQNDYILQTGKVMLLISLLSAVCAILVSLLSARTAAGVSRDMRKAVFQKVEGFSNSEFDKFSTASLITRSTNDVTQIQMVVIMMMRIVFYAPIMGVGGIIRAVNKDSSMWWIIAVGVGMLLSLVVIVFALSLPKFKRMQTQIDRLNLVMRENLSGMMVIRAFNMQPFELKRFDGAIKELSALHARQRSGAVSNAIGLAELRRGTAQRKLFACGPTPLLKAVGKIAEDFNVPAELSMDEFSEFTRVKNSVNGEHKE